MSVAEIPTYTAEEEKYVIRNSSGVPVGVKPHSRWTPGKVILWVVIALLGATGWTTLAILRGEEVNAIWFVITALCTYAIGYRYYALYIQRKIMRPNDLNATPAERVNNGRDYEPTQRVVLFGHHFAAIAGAGPLVGPVLSAQMGYLPGTLWIIFGVLVAGAVQDMLVLHFSMRRGGRSLGKMAQDEIGKIGGTVATIMVLVMLMIVLAVLAMICVNALAESPWGVFAVGMTIPIAIVMGLLLRFVMPGKVTAVSIGGFIALVATIIGGKWVADSALGEYLQLTPTQLVIAMVIYGFFAAVLPVWLLLTPRDYLSTFMKIGTIIMLAVGIVIVRPVIQVPAITEFASNTEGPVFAGALFPFLFITVACGALSGMHATVSSGTSPKMIEKESQVRMVGYGGMLAESFVAIMALAAAASLNPGVYYSMNMSAATMDNTADAAVVEQFEAGEIGREDVAASAVRNLNVTDTHGEGLVAEWETWDEQGNEIVLQDGEAIAAVAADVGEPSVVSRTGGAPTLAVAMANILHQLGGGTAMMSFWYHFAIMFEALFILSAVDAVTRVARFQVGEAIGGLIPKFRDPSWQVGSWISTALVVAAWGSLLLMGVTDPRGGIQTLYPLFGIANQLIAAIALTLVTVMVVRKGYAKYAWIPALPLAFDVAVTFYASYQKIFSPDPALGYFTQWNNAKAALAELQANGGDSALIADTQAVVRNSLIQGTMSVVFVVTVAFILVMAIARIIVTLRKQDTTTSEDPFIESNYFAPATLVASPLDKKVAQEYAVVGDPEFVPGARRHMNHGAETAAGRAAAGSGSRGESSVGGAAGGSSSAGSSSAGSAGPREGA